MTADEKGTTAVRSVFEDVVPYLLAFAALTPFCFARLAPSMDAPAHLALAAVAQNLAAHDPILGAQFEWGVFIAPNTLLYVLALGLGLVMPLAKAGVVIVCLALASAVVGYTELAVLFGRSRYVALALVPVAAQWTLIEGLVDYTLGVGLMGLALANAVRYVDGGGTRAGVSAFCLSGLVFVAHIQATLTYVACCLFLGIVALRRPFSSHAKTLLRRMPVLVCLPVVLAAIWRFVSREALDRVTAGGSTHVNPGENRYLELLFKGPLTLDDFSQGYMVLALFVALVGGRFLHERARGSRARSEGPGVAGSDAYLMGVLAGSFVVIAVAPMDFGYYFHIGVRAIPIAWWIGVVLMIPRGEALDGVGIRITRYAMLAGAAAIACASYVGAVRTWNGYTKGFVPTLARAPQGSRLILVQSSGARDGFASNLAAHLHQYHTVVNRGTSTFSFGYYPGRIVREISANALPQSVLSSQLDPYLAYGCFDYVLSNEPLARPNLTRVSQSGVYELYRVRSTCPRVVAFRGGGNDDGGVVGAPCPSGQPLRGVRIFTRPAPFALEGVAPLCGAYGTTARVDQDADAPSATDLRCADGESLVGIGGASGSALTRVEIGCARGGHLRRLGVGTERDGARPFFETCPNGTVGGFVRARRGNSLERVELGCVAR